MGGDRVVGDAGCGEGDGVGVLGPTTIGSRSATPRQRALVAALALAGRRGAEIDELVDGVWSGRPPNSARSSLQNQMTRLRRAHGDDLIVCETARYRLGRPTDVERFEDTLARVRSAPVTPATITSLADVLALWRGQPYADLADCHAAEVERARLVQARDRAANLLATGRILTGDYAPCIAELRVEVEDDPFRDRAWELLFIALQRAERTGEAIAAHHRYVARLRDQFGVEPSRSLLEIGHALSRGVPLDLAAGEFAAGPAVVDLSATGRHGARRSRCRERRTGRARRVDP